MPRTREDMPLSFWLDYGENLTKHLIGNNKVHRTVKKLVTELCTNPAPNLAKQNELVTALNEYKNELGPEWSKWKKRIRQLPKDAERVRFYVSQKCHDDFGQLAKDAGNPKLVKYLETLPEQIALNGLNTNGAFYDLYDLLTPFADAMVADYALTLNSDDGKPELSVLAVLNKITTELKKNNIQDYKSLCAQLKQATETDEYINTLRNQVDKKNQLIKELKAEIVTVKRRKTKANKAITDLQNENKQLEEELKKCRAPKKRKPTIKKKRAQTTSKSR